MLKSYHFLSRKICKWFDLQTCPKKLYIPLELQKFNSVLKPEDPNHLCDVTACPVYLSGYIPKLRQEISQNQAFTCHLQSWSYTNGKNVLIHQNGKDK